LAGITTASSTNPYLLKIEPGIYDIGTSSLQMKVYVDVEGSGENTTTITGHIDGGVVLGSGYAEIRFLTVQNTGGGTNAVAIYNTSASPKITNVTASASAGSYQNCGVVNISSSPRMTNVTASGSGGPKNCGVHNLSSSPAMMNVTASGSGGTGSMNCGVVNCFGSPTMTNVTASGSGGTDNYGVYSTNPGTIMIHNSVIIGSTNTIFNDANTTTRVANTKLDGGAVSNSGTLTCVGAYDETYIALNTTCQ
jgi:hypothetical protein